MLIDLLLMQILHNLGYKGANFLGSVAVWISFQHRLTSGGCLRKSDTLRNSGLQNRDGIVSKGFHHITAYSPTYDLSVNRKYGFQVRLNYGNLGNQIDNFTRRPYIIRGWLHGNYYHVACGYRGFCNGINARGAVNDNPIIGSRKRGDLAVKGISR